MAFDELGRRIQEAIHRRPITATPPQPGDVNARRQSYVPGIPIGGSTETNPADSTSSGALDRHEWMDQLFRAYLACNWSSDCIDQIARSCTAGGISVVPKSVSLTSADSPNMPPEMRMVQGLLEFVNDQHDIRQLMRGVITDLQVYGDSFTEVVWWHGHPVALFPIDPRTIDIISDEHGNITKYFQTTDTNRTESFAPHEVIHVQLDPPGGGIYGVSPTQKNILPIQIFLFTDALIEETMRAGDPLRAHVDWPMALPPSEMQRFQEQYRIRNRGAKNIGNLFETKGGATVQELGINQIVSWQNVKSQCRDEIISGYGVPPSKVGVIESANIGGGQGVSQDATFRINTCGPLQELILEKFAFALIFEPYGITEWTLKFGEVDWKADLGLEELRDMRLRNGSWSLNDYLHDIGRPPIGPAGDIRVLVDRQNMSVWEDIAPLSKANVDAIKAKANPASPAGSGGSPQQSPGPGQNENWPRPIQDDDQDHPYVTEAKQRRLDREYRNSYNARLAELLQGITP